MVKDLELQLARIRADVRHSSGELSLAELTKQLRDWREEQARRLGVERDSDDPFRR